MATTPLTDAEKARVRLHAGYPIYGNQAELASLKWGQEAWQIQVQNQQLEFAMSNLADVELDTVRSELLPNLEALRGDVFNTRNNADTAQAAVWTRNPHEFAERTQLYTAKRIELCQFLNLAAGPMLSGGGNTRFRC